MSDDPIAALHMAARRYCVDHIARWNKVYAALRAGRPETFALTYTDDDYRTFPRYNVLGAIRSAVESWLPSEVATLDEARAWLVDAARTAESPFTRGSNAIAQAAMVEERLAFEAFASTSTPDDWAAAAPLPFRRVLAAADAAALLEGFRRRWGCWYAGHGDRDDVPLFVTLHEEVWYGLPLRAAVNGFFAATGAARLVEIQEVDDSYEIDSVAARLDYYQGEAIWMVRGGDWMIYVSHESSVTFGGAALVAWLRAALPRLDDFAYLGWQDPPSGRGVR